MKLSLLLSVFVGFLMAGCSQGNADGQSVKASQSEDKNIKLIEEVLKVELTVPDPEYIELIKERPIVSPNSSEDEIEKAQAFSEKYTAYVSSKYKPYFTENGLENFIATGPAYQYHEDDKQYTLTIEDMEVVQSEIETAKNQYSITAHVAYEEPNKEKEVYEIIGKAIISKEGKIGKLSIGEKEQLLLKKLRGN